MRGMSGAPRKSLKNCCELSCEFKRVRERARSELALPSFVMVPICCMRLHTINLAEKSRVLLCIPEKESESIDLIILRPEDQDLGDKDLIRPSSPIKLISGLSISVILLHSSPQSARHK